LLIKKWEAVRMGRLLGKRLDRQVARRIKVMLLILCIMGTMLSPRGMLGNRGISAYAAAVEVQIAAGSEHTLMLKSDGTVWAWGYNQFGELGNGTRTQSNVPIQVPGLTNVIAISAGNGFSMALTADGSVWAWGRNNSANLGVGNTTLYYWTPQKINITNVKAISAGNDHSMILKTDGTVYTCGINYYGQLGLGISDSAMYSTTYQKLDLINDVKEISAGKHFCLALKTDGTVWGWGDNSYGQVGPSGTVVTSPQYLNINDVKAIAAGGYFSLTLKTDGKIYSWGITSYGALGLGSPTGTSISTPTCISTIGTAKAISAGVFYGAAIATDGSVWTWGHNVNGQLGDGTLVSAYTPIKNTTLSNATTIECGSNHMLTITDNSKLMSWGNNIHGQLGDGTTTQRTTPVLINKDPSITSTSLTDGMQFYKTDTNCVPTFIVKDENNDTLTCTYFIDNETTARDTKTVTNTITDQTVTLAPINFSSLSNGKHIVKYQVSDGLSAVTKSVTIEKIGDESASIIDALKIEPFDNKISVSIKVFDNSKVLAPTPYSYSIDGFAPIKTTLANYTFTGLTPNSKHTITATIEDLAGNKETYTQEIYTKAQIPVIATTLLPDNIVQLTLTDTNPSDTQYQIQCGSQYINAIGRLSTVPVWMTLPDKKLTIEGLKLNTPYSFKVKAKNKEALETDYSNASTITVTMNVPTVPTNFTAQSSANKIILAWDPVIGAKTYEIEVDGKIIKNGSKTTYSHEKLKTNSQHTYRVRAINQAGEGSWSAIKVILTELSMPAVPINLSEDITNTSVTVNWNEDPNIEAYEIEFDGKILTQTTCNFYMMEGLKPSTSHNYRIRAINNLGLSAWTTLKTISTFALPTPIAYEGVVGETSIEINWDAVEGATSYEITADGVTTNVGLLTTFTRSGLTQNTAHTYRVRAIGASGNSNWCEEMPVNTLPVRPIAPSDMTGIATDKSIKLQWTPVGGVEGYDLEIDGVVIENGSDTTYEHLELDPYSAHSYRIRSRNSLIEGLWSNYFNISTLAGKPNAPKTISVSTVGKVSTITWEAKPGSVRYEIEVDGVIYNAGNHTSYIHRNITLAHEHLYRIRSINKLGKSDWSGYIVNNSMRVVSTKGKELELGLTASNITDFSKYELSVYYNKDVFKVKDLCAKTNAIELIPGYIEQEGITITSVEEGKITFTVEKAIEVGYDWTGIINNILFDGQVSGGTTIDYTVYIIPQ